MAVDYAHFISLHLTNDRGLYDTARDVARTAAEGWQPMTELADFYGDETHGRDRSRKARLREASDALGEWVLDSLHETLDQADGSGTDGGWEILLVRELLPGKGDVEWDQVVESLFDDDEFQWLMDGE